MTAQREGQLSWLDVLPFEKMLCRDTNPEVPILIDIGGGVGHQCATFKARFPNLLGRVILQDMPQTISQAISTPGVETMAHDFCTPQSIRGTSIS